ncbi:MAG: tetratricopeptide repeat protein [Candidatus Firestonebacteria bacterium]
MEESILKEIEDMKRKLEDESDSMLFLKLAELYHRNGMKEEAMNVCKRGLEINPENLNIRVFLSKMFLEKDMFKEAKEELEKILIVDHLNILAKTMLETILRYENRFEEADKIREQVNLIQKNNSKINDFKDRLETPTVAEICVQQGLIEEAIRVYERIVLSNPLDLNINNRLKELRRIRDEKYLDFQLKKQKIKDALNELQKSLKQIQDVMQDLEKEL